MKMRTIATIMLSALICSSPLSAKMSGQLKSMGVALNNGDTMYCKTFAYGKDEDSNKSTIYIETKDIEKILGVDAIKVGQYLILGKEYTELDSLSNVLGMDYVLSEKGDKLDLTYKPDTETRIFNTYKSSSNVNDGVTLSIVNNKLNYKIYFIEPPLSYTVSVSDKKTGDLVERHHVKNTRNDTVISGSIQLPALSDGVYTVTLFENTDKSIDTLYSFTAPVEMNVVNGNSEIELGSVYNHNKFKVNQFYSLDKDKLLVYEGDEKSKDVIFNISKELCKGVSDDYTKAKILYKYVCNAMVYDTDKILQGREEVQPLSKILESNIGICGDYALLYRELLRSVGIPTMTVSGYVDNGKDISNSSSIISNHAWNMSFIDGRWVVSDCTYGSRNRVSNEVKTIRLTNTYACFDMSLENLSRTHKLLDVYEYVYE